MIVDSTFSSLKICESSLESSFQGQIFYKVSVNGNVGTFISRYGNHTDMADMEMS